jgi:cytochrome c553
MKKMMIALVASVWLSPALAVEMGDDKAAYAACVACHGAQGEGNDALKAPAIAGQSEEYLVRQLNNFKSGLRGASPDDAAGGQMRGIANTLVTDESVQSVAAYVAAMPHTWAEVPEGADLGNGNNYYEAICGACHGGRAEGNDKLKAPRLAGLSVAYMKRQYANLKHGIRGDHPEDKYGKRIAVWRGALSGRRGVRTQ